MIKSMELVWEVKRSIFDVTDVNGNEYVCERDSNGGWSRHYGESIEVVSKDEEKELEDVYRALFCA